MSRIVLAVGIGIIVLIGLAYIFIRSLASSPFTVFIPNQDKTPTYVLGEILVTLKPYTDVEILDEFVRLHAELSRKQNKITLPSFATLSLKPYGEWQKKVSPSRKDDPEVRTEIIEGEALLLGVYEKLKTDPLLSNSNIWNSFYSDIEPQKNYFAVIHIFFKEGVSQQQRAAFFQQFPQLEIVQDNEGSRTYVIYVLQGKEQYWIFEFLKQNFVKGAAVNAIMHLTR